MTEKALLWGIFILLSILVLFACYFLFQRLRRREEEPPPPPNIETKYFAQNAAGQGEIVEPECTPLDRFKSWHRRHAVVWFALRALLISVFGPYLTNWLIFTLTATPQLHPGQDFDPDGGQVWAANHAAGWKSFGAVTSIIFAGTGYFALALLMAWRVLRYLFPSLPVWSKKHYTTKFTESTDYKWQIDTVNRITGWLWALYAACILAASLSQ